MRRADVRHVVTYDNARDAAYFTRGVRRVVCHVMYVYINIYNRERERERERGRERERDIIIIIIIIVIVIIIIVIIIIVIILLTWRSQRVRCDSPLPSGDRHPAEADRAEAWPIVCYIMQQHIYNIMVS